jgi:nitrogen regulatory protein P-II 1
MKKIEAVIRPTKLDEVKDALDLIGVQGMMIIEIKGFGRQRGNSAHTRGIDFGATFHAKTMIQIVARDDQAPAIVGAIIESARTGRVGDGKIFVSDVAEVIRIRTGETNAEAV